MPFSINLYSYRTKPEYVSQKVIFDWIWNQSGNPNSDLKTHCSLTCEGNRRWCQVKGPQRDRRCPNFALPRKYHCLAPLSTNSDFLVLFCWWLRWTVVFQVGDWWYSVSFLSFDCRNLPAIMSWVEAQRPGMDGVNIITSDFVELTDFANIVIKLNNLLLSEQGHKARWQMFEQRDKCAAVICRLLLTVLVESHCVLISLHINIG